MICKGCGRTISDEAIVCSFCAHPVLAASRSFDPDFAFENKSLEMRDFASKKVAAGVCGILLGTFGVHKFIIGQTKAGLIMLAATFCSCFILAVPMHVIGIIEGIIYLTKTDREFYQIYGMEQRSWF